MILSLSIMGIDRATGLGDQWVGVTGGHFIARYEPTLSTVERKTGTPNFVLQESHTSTRCSDVRLKKGQVLRSFRSVS